MSYLCLYLVHQRGGDCRVVRDDRSRPLAVSASEAARSNFAAKHWMILDRTFSLSSASTTHFSVFANLQKSSSSHCHQLLERQLFQCSSFSSDPSSICCGRTAICSPRRPTTVWLTDRQRDPIPKRSLQEQQQHSRRRRRLRPPSSTNVF